MEQRFHKYMEEMKTRSMDIEEVDDKETKA